MDVDVMKGALHVAENVRRVDGGIEILCMTI